MLIIKRNDAFDKATAATQRQSARTRTNSNEQKHKKKTLFNFHSQYRNKCVAC